MTASATTVALDPLLACAPSVSSALALTLALSLAPSLNPKSPTPHLSPHTTSLVLDRSLVPCPIARVVGP